MQSTNGRRQALRCILELFVSSARMASFAPESGRGLPQSKTLREYVGVSSSARFWTAPALWRFSGTEESPYNSEMHGKLCGAAGVSHDDGRGTAILLPADERHPGA